MILRERTDGLFEAWGRLVYARRYRVLALCLIFVATAATFLPHLEAENSTESYLRGGDPIAIEYEEFQRRFGQDDRLMVAVESSEIFSIAFLERLRAFHEAAENELPDVAKVTSLINIRETRGEDDALIVEDLTERWPETAADLADLRERVFANPLYVDNVISRDALLTTVTIEPVVYLGGDEDSETALAGFADADADAGEARPFLPEARKGALVEALSALVERHEAPGFRLHVVGSSVVAHYITDAMTSDTRLNVSVTALSIAGFLFLVFRRISGVVFPMLVVAATLILELGVMVWLGIPFSITLGMIPVFTMCVVVCCAVHILVLVYQRRATGAGPEESIAYAFNHSGLAIFMTSLTTACGMMSFLTAGLEPVRHMGVVAPLGVLFAFLMTMTLLPALIAIFPLRQQPRIGPAPDRSWSQHALMWTGDLAVRRPWRVVGGAALLAVFFAVGLSNARFSHEPHKWLPAGDPIRLASEMVDERLGGASSAEVILDSGRENGLHDPALLRRIDAAIARAEAIERGPVYVGKAVSLVDIVKETHQALNANDPDYYAIPDERRLLAQELLLFENSGNEDLEDITDTEFQRARVTLRVPLVDAVLYDELLDDVQAAFAGVSEQPIVLTGRSAISSRTFGALIESMATSYLVALAVITPLMMALIGNVRLGLISMVPNLFPVFATLGVMGWLGFPLDASSIMIGSVTISLAVDDTIHVMHRFRLDFERSGDTRTAVRETLRTTGSALLFTSVVLVTGFSVMGALGTMQNTVVFGAMSALGIAFAFLSDALLTPALIRLGTPSGRASGATSCRRHLAVGMRKREDFRVTSQPEPPIDPRLKKQLRRVARKQRRGERLRGEGGAGWASLREIRRAAILRIGKRSRPIIDGILARYSVLGDESFPDPKHFAWVEGLEAKADVIAAELERVLREVARLPALREISPDHNRIAQEDWKAFFLYGYGHRSEIGCRLCPETAKAVEKIPQLESAFFSILLPGMHIKHHKGPTKSLLVCHLGVKIPKQAEKCVIRVGDEIRPWQQGKLLVIDDTHDHEVWNDTDETRVVLLIHVRRPLRFPGSLVGSAIFNAIRLSPFVKDGRRNLDDWERGFGEIDPTAPARHGGV